MFHVGQMVVCIDDNWRKAPLMGETFPAKGRVYTIRQITNYTKLCLRFHEITNPPRAECDGVEATFTALNFRPVAKTDISIFQAMLAPSRQNEAA